MSVKYVYKILLTFIKLFCGRMIRTSLNDFLNMLWLHVDWHSPDDCAWWWGTECLEAYRTCGRHADVEFLQFW